MEEVKDFNYLGIPFQESFLKTIIDDKKFGEIIIDSVYPKYFENGSYRIIFTHIKELFEAHKKIPTFETVKQKILIEETPGSTSLKMYLDTLEIIKKHVVGDINFTKTQSINFCKQQKLKEAIRSVSGILETGSFSDYVNVENIIQKAMQIGVNNIEMVDALGDPTNALSKDSREPFPTGVDGLDVLLKGGLAKKELGVVLAPTGIGKSTLLTKFANSAHGAGGHVVQLFFEDNINAILRKHYTIWTGIMSDEQPEYESQIKGIINTVKSSSEGSLSLIKLPSDGTTLLDIKSKIRKHINDGNKIDMLIIDYVDCITSDKTHGDDEWKGEGQIMRAIETMASEFDIAIWVATQGDRSSIASEVVMTNQMGGSIKKAQIGHVIVSVGKTLEQKAHKLATMTLLKSRIGDDGIIFANCQFDNGLLLINTDNQNTLLGHKSEEIIKKNNRIQEVYRNSQEFKNHSITGSAQLTV